MRLIITNEGNITKLAANNVNNTIYYLQIKIGQPKTLMIIPIRIIIVILWM